MKKVVYLLMCSSLLVIGGCTFSQNNRSLSQDSMPYTISGEQWAGIRTEDMLLSRQLVNKKLRFDLDKIGTKNVTEKG